MDSIINEIHTGSKDYLVRKSKWLFVIIIFKMFIVFSLTVLVLFILYVLNKNVGYHITNVIVVFMYFLLLISYISVIISLVNYFYNVIIITNKGIYKLKLGLFFNEEIDIIDLYKVQEIKSQTKGFFQVFFNVGELHLVEQKDTEKIIHFIDRPEEVARIIKGVQHKLVETRYNK